MPTATFLAAEALFGNGGVTVWDWELGTHIARGHLTSAQLDAAIVEYNNSSALVEDIAVIPGSLKYTWTRFAAHTPRCLVNAPAQPDEDGDIDVDLCDCDPDEAECETVSPDVPGAIPVTWVYAYSPADPFRPDYQREPDEARDYIDRLRALGWFDDATNAPVLTERIGEAVLPGLANE